MRRDTPNIGSLPQSPVFANKKWCSNVGYFSRFVSVIIAGDKRGAKANKKALTLANQGFSFGAGEMNRTPDLLITNSGANCCQLSPIAVFTLDEMILTARSSASLCRTLVATVT
jgi:hypothetical protein